VYTVNLKYALNLSSFINLRVQYTIITIQIWGWIHWSYVTLKKNLTNLTNITFVMPSSIQGLLPSHSPVQRAAIGSTGQAWAFYGARAAEDAAGTYGWLLNSVVFVVPMPEGLGWLQLSWLHCPVLSSQSHSHYLSHLIIWRQYNRKLISGGERISVSSLNTAFIQYTYFCNPWKVRTNVKLRAKHIYLLGPIWYPF